MAAARSPWLPIPVPTHHHFPLPLFFTFPPRIIPTRNALRSIATSALYTEGISATAAAAAISSLPPPPDLDQDAITLLNDRIRRDHAKREGTKSGKQMDSAEAEQYIRMVKQQQQIGLKKLRGEQGGGAGYQVDPYSLLPGDHVVHKKVGIGRFTAIKYDLPKDGSEPIEYVFIEFADGMAKLPVKQACRMLYRYNLGLSIFCQNNCAIRALTLCSLTRKRSIQTGASMCSFFYS